MGGRNRAPLLKPWLNNYVIAGWNCRKFIIPEFRRWCRISSIHGMIGSTSSFGSLPGLSSWGAMNGTNRPVRQHHQQRASLQNASSISTGRKYMFAKKQLEADLRSCESWLYVSASLPWSMVLWGGSSFEFLAGCCSGSFMNYCSNLVDSCPSTLQERGFVHIQGPTQNRGAEAFLVAASSLHFILGAVPISVISLIERGLV